jgi:inner membrane transporter RhtA
MAAAYRARDHSCVRARDLPPATVFVGSATFHYLGPAFAVLLFARVAPPGVAWLRIASAAAVFAAWRRPWRRLGSLDRGGRRLVAALGTCLALMNVCFYLAIARLPLGTVAAIEFLPLIALAALGAHTLRNGLALALAVTGVALLAEVRLDNAPLGLAFALANAALFAVYVVLGHRVSRIGTIAGIDGLAAAMLVALAVATPLGAWSAAPAVLDPVAVSAGIGVGLTSSVVPYVCDQLAMARLQRSTYALLVSLLPATATAIGVVVLRQLPTLREAAGVAVVAAGVALRRDGPPTSSSARPGGSERSRPRDRGDDRRGGDGAARRADDGHDLDALLAAEARRLEEAAVRRRVVDVDPPPRAAGAPHRERHGHGIKGRH